MSYMETVHYDKVRAIYSILHGEREADLLLKNLNILDVHGETVYQGSILVYDKRIIALNPDESVVKVKEVFDGKGLYAIPGLIDAHIHFESQLAHPTALAEAILSLMPLDSDRSALLHRITHRLCDDLL